MPSYTPMNQGPICAKVYPEGIQPIKGNNCGLIPTDRPDMTLDVYRGRKTTTEQQHRGQIKVKMVIY